ncbi:zona pellucida sperm-binding protein 3-like [Festucalex cinctus]
MDRFLCSTFFILFAVFTVTESRRYHLVSYDRGGAYGPSVASTSGQSQVPSQQLHEVRPKAVLVRCHPDSMELMILADLFDLGLLVEPGHLRLGADPAAGSGSCRARPTGDGETLTIWAGLLDCGTRLSSTQDKIIYSNALVYSPEPSSEGLFRLDEATIPVECHFDKRYSVGGLSLRPAWIPSVSVRSAESRIDFKLRLMTDNWLFERRSNAYFLGDPMHFEVSVMVRKHKPLRVYVEHCTATAGPDPRDALRYDFIEHNGCLSDALHTKSSSHFLPRIVSYTLQFQLDAFRFHHQPNSQVYITCGLRAIPDSSAASSQHRACSFIDNRWRSADGDHASCQACDQLGATKEMATDTRLPPNLGQNFGPYIPKKPTNYLSVHPETFQSHTAQFPSSGLKREKDYKPARVVQVGPLTIQ